MQAEDLKNEYVAVEPRAQRLRTALLHEIDQLLTSQDLALGVPLEARVKSWESLQEKLDRKALELDGVVNLDDLVGIRAILLFRSDLPAALVALTRTFDVISMEDTSARLADSQFGYQSQHLIVRLPASWSNIPSFKGLVDLRAEIQVRTLAQHIWAAASHKLQYKQEQSVPPPLRRTIYRISALLETVDLELDRVLEERRNYTAQVPTASPEQTLNVDLLASVLDAELPRANKSESENYNSLLSDLLELGIRTSGDLLKLLTSHKTTIQKKEKERLQKAFSDHAAGEKLIGTTPERVVKGVFFTHSGMVRTALRAEFGDKQVSALVVKRLKKKAASKRIDKKG